MINIKLKNKVIKINHNTSILDIIDKSEKPNLVVGGLVDNEVKSLNYSFTKDVEFEFIYLDTLLGDKIYEKTLALLLTCASKKALEKEIVIKYSFGGGLYFEYLDSSVITKQDVKKLLSQIQHMIDLNLPIEKKKLDRNEVKSLLEDSKITLTNKDILDSLNIEKMTLYKLHDVYGYFYGDLLPCTKYIFAYDIIKYKDGAVLLGVNRHNIPRIHDFYDNPKLYEEYENFDKWLQSIGATNISSLNKKISEGKSKEIILASEARYEFLLATLAKKIIYSKEKKKIILITGPSSSGKTTTSKRLKSHLLARGKEPITISIDDYFINRDKVPLDEKTGKPLFESIKSVDTKKFNEDILALLNGEEVSLPTYNFITGKREYNGNKIKINDNMPIIIEGIHAFTKELTKDIPDDLKFKVYICPFTVMNIDQYNRITTSKIRLLRRIVRDNRTRGHKAIDTINMWEDVRLGEKENIYPYRNEADFIFNATLLYEIPIFKKYAYPLLKEIPKTEKNYFEVLNLIDFLSFFKPLENEDAIPNTSVLREFIGGSVYED